MHDPQVHDAWPEIFTEHICLVNMYQGGGRIGCPNHGEKKHSTDYAWHTTGNVRKSNVL